MVLQVGALELEESPTQRLIERHRSDDPVAAQEIGVHALPRSPERNDGVRLFSVGGYVAASGAREETPIGVRPEQFLGIEQDAALVTFELADQGAEEWDCHLVTPCF